MVLATSAAGWASCLHESGLPHRFDMKSQREPESFPSLQQGVLDWASPSLLRPEKKQKG